MLLIPTQSIILYFQVNFNINLFLYISFDYKNINILLVVNTFVNISVCLNITINNKTF